MLIKITNTSGTAIGDVQANSSSYCSLGGIACTSYDEDTNGAVDALHFHSSGNSPVGIQDISSSNSNWSNLVIEVFTEHPSNNGVLIASN